MKYFKGKQNLTEKNPFLNTTSFLFIEEHNLRGIDKFLMESSRICKAHFILVQHTLQIFIVDGMKNNTETIQIYMGLYFVLKYLSLKFLQIELNLTSETLANS